MKAENTLFIGFILISLVIIPAQAEISPQKVNLTALQKEYLYQANNAPSATLIQEHIGWARQMVGRLGEVRSPRPISFERLFPSLSFATKSKSPGKSGRPLQHLQMKMKTTVKITRVQSIIRKRVSTFFQKWKRPSKQHILFIWKWRLYRKVWPLSCILFPVGIEGWLNNHHRASFPGS